MGAFARIPIIEQTVGTPRVGPVSVPPPPRIESPAAAAVQPLAKAGEELGRILEVQGRHQQILDADAAEENYKNTLTDAYVKAKQLPGAQWAPTVQQQGSDLAKQMLADPANAHIVPYLQKRLPAIQGLIYRDALEAGATQTAREQDGQLKVLTKGLAAQAGADFGPNFADGPTAQAARQKANSLIDAMWPKNPSAAGFYKSEFENQIVTERAQAIARNRPELLGDFLNANSDKFSPQQQGALMNTATMAINAPLRRIEANNNAARAAAIQYQNDYIAKNGQPDVARLDHDAQFKLITDGDYRNFTGRDYQMPSDPAILASYRAQIAHAADSSELETIKANARAAADHKLLNGGDVPVLENMAQQRIKYFQSEQGQEHKNGIDQIRRAYQNLGQNAFIYNKLAAIKGQPTLAELHANALNDFNAAVTPNMTRAQVNTAWRKAIKDNQPDFAAVGIKASAPPPAVPPMNEDALLNAARAKGIIR